MFRKIILVFIGVFLFLGFKIAEASVIINEVQINPKENSFIELYNTGDSSIDLTNWSIKRETSSGKEYPLVSATKLKGKTIPANGYFLIANESSYSGDGDLDATWATSYSLANNNSVLLLNSDGKEIDKIGWGSCYDSCVAENPANEKSIQRTNSDWIISSPTPGEENEELNEDDSDDDDDDEEESDDEDEDDDDDDEEDEEKEEINKTKIVVKSPAFVGLPLLFKINNSVSEDSCGMYLLNFGDGGSIETEKVSRISQKFSHIYYYEGEYIVNLECYESYLSTEPINIDKITMKVIQPTVFISNVGDEKDFFIEISNITSFEMNISNWVLSSFSKKFTFPKNSIIKAKSKVIISPKITGFSILDKNTLKLSDSEGEIKLNNSLFIKSTKNPAKNFIPVKISENNYINENISKNNLEEDKTFEKKLESNTNKENNSIYGFGLFAFLIISAGTTFFIRSRNRKTIPKTEGSDFEIIDE